MAKRTKNSSGPKPAAPRRRSKQHPDHNPKAGVRVMPPSKAAQDREKEVEAAKRRTEYKPAPKTTEEKS